MRVHELAKELGLASKDLIHELKEIGVEAKNHMSALESDAVEKIRAKFQPSQKKEVQTSKPVVPAEAPKIEKPLTKPEPVDAPKAEPISKPEIVETKPEAAVSLEEKKPLHIGLPISVKDFAQKIEIPANQFIAKLIDLGEMLTVNQFLTDKDMVTLLGAEFGFQVHFDAKKEEKPGFSKQGFDEERTLELVPRAPVVAFMGHVDHGKTSLLDYIRKTKVVDQESGGITQHIGAYQVHLKKGAITFLDTPGHEAFTMMRSRGAQITDIVVLVIAADDGMMPQTHEAINHCKAANVPMIIALNKVDKPNISLDKVRRQLSEKGMMPEDWGGQTIICEVSAKTGKGVDHLLEMILIQSEIMEIKSDPKGRGLGVIIESELTTGKGPTATLLVRQGTFRTGDAVVCGAAYGRIKALIDDQGRQIKEAGPSLPVELLGLSEVPEVGAEIKTVKNEKIAREMAELNAEEMKKSKDFQPKKMTLEDVFQKISNATVKEFRLILKADVKGSLEALKSCLSGIKSELIEIRMIHEAVGDITDNDVMLASASKAIIIGFQVRLPSSVKDLAKKEGVEIRVYSIIYEIVDDIKLALEGLLEPIETEVVVGHAAVQKVFELSKSGKVAGCMVQDGKVMRSSKVRVLRAGEKIHEGSLQSLKRFKDEVREVAKGFECGIRIEGFPGVEEGDILEFYEIQKTSRKLA